MVVIFGGDKNAISFPPGVARFCKFLPAFLPAFPKHAPHVHDKRRVDRSWNDNIQDSRHFG
jgi:hypothetical protein